MGEDVGALDERVQEADVFRAIEIDVGAPLAEAGVYDDVDRILLMRSRDVDHVRALLRKETRRDRPCENMGHVDDPNAGERPGPRREGNRIAVADAFDLDGNPRPQMTAL